MSLTLRIISALVALSAGSRWAAGEKPPDRAPDTAGLAFELRPEQVEPGERARLSVALPLSAIGLADVDEETELPALNDDLLLEAHDLQVLDRDFRRERDQLVWTFDVVAHKDGKYNLPPLEVRFGAQSFSTETVLLTVKSSRAPGDEALRPDYGAVGIPWRWKLWALGLVALAVTVFLWRKFAHRRRLLARLLRSYGTRFRRSWSEPSPENVLRRELKLCRDALAGGGAPAAILDRATHAVRWYLTRRQARPANAWTTEELDRYEALASRELADAFVRGDRARFASSSAADGDEARAVAAALLEAATRAWAGPGAEWFARWHVLRRETGRRVRPLLDRFAKSFDGASR
jgi:hypothetical protein